MNKLICLRAKSKCSCLNNKFNWVKWFRWVPNQNDWFEWPNHHCEFLNFIFIGAGPNMFFNIIGAVGEVCWYSNCCGFIVIGVKTRPNTTCWFSFGVIGMIAGPSTNCWFSFSIIGVRAGQNTNCWFNLINPLEWNDSAKRRISWFECIR